LDNYFRNSGQKEDLKWAKNGAFLTKNGTFLNRISEIIIQKFWNFQSRYPTVLTISPQNFIFLASLLTILLSCY